MFKNVRKTKKMFNKKGMTLAEILIAMSLFAIISLMFTSGLMAVLNIIRTANNDRKIENAVDEMILTGEEVKHLDDKVYEIKFDDIQPYTATIKFNGSNTEIKVKGTLNRASVEYNNSNRLGALRLQYIYEGLDK